ncbi:type I-E CRISPR-associated protein Cse2/CasB [Nitrosomonas sp. Nm58]|uniref:type I-E CRISPR-associated protein Cse2/CasB n=1 Tax=Nitrosomonas sp. Nm58 TaxID=200126 RepID=UPI0008983B8F|nr:type I-E CRISPR-associated protein Cse2/CasB [Nitrosomonas sp. Nm58]SDY50304.1 CRISPR system Cascade subunit CasB [Nitrosomonas sp. Nm58]
MSAELPDFVALKMRYDNENFPTGARAELRRAAEPDDVALTPAFYRLFPGQKPDDRHLRLAFLLPCCKHAAKAKSFGAQLAEANVTEARVLQVARSHAPLDLVQLRRLMTHIESTVDWSEFGRMVWYWNDRAKRQLVEDFYIARFNPVKGDKK